MSIISSEFSLEGDTLPVTGSVWKAWNENGYVIVRNFLKHEELSLLHSLLSKDDKVLRNEFHKDDADGRKVTQLIWNQPGEDIVDRIALSTKALDLVETLLGGPVYMYNNALSMKAPYSGGAFTWHQDYGYNYVDGCLFPMIGTFFIAVYDVPEESGCLQFMTGSHKMGRLDHVAVGTQVSADPERVAWAAKRLPVHKCPMKAGDAVFFHCNTLHFSGRNNSPSKRWGLLPVYNRSTNSPVYQGTHPSAVFEKPLQRIPNSEILKATVGIEDKEFYDFKNAQVTSVAIVNSDKSRT